MNKTVVVMTAKAGKMREAIASVKALVEYAHSKHGLNAEVYMQSYGVAGTLYVIGQSEDMATAQAMQAKLLADEGYWAIAQKMAEVMIGPPTITLLQPV
jgi:quinol monooxygenase YgiN